MKKLIVVGKIILLIAVAVSGYYVGKISHEPENSLCYYAIKNVIYKHTDSTHQLTLDIYRPQNISSKNSPAIIYFHGGSWVSGDKSKIHQCYRQDALESFINNGFIVISVDYRLISSDSVTLKESIEDCRDAINFIVKSGDAFQIDTTKIGLWGSSAGAHLAISAAVMPDSLLNNSINRNNISFIIDDFGPMDLTSMLNNLKTFIKDDAINTDSMKSNLEIAAKTYSALEYIDNLKSPIIIFHGKKDIIVSENQSEFLRLALHNLNKKAYIFRFDDQGHGFNSLSEEQKQFYVNKCINFAIQANKNHKTHSKTYKKAVKEKSRKSKNKEKRKKLFNKF